MIHLVPLYKPDSDVPSKITGSFRFRGSPKLFMLTPGRFGWTLSCRGYDQHTFPTWQDGVTFLENSVGEW